jgi:tripartite-type tricarboxylate transporter receptor subunit TctC
MQRRNILGTLFGLGLLGLPLASLAQTGWPVKPARIIVPVPPGGSLDILARTIAKDLGPKLHQSVVVENMAGGGSNIAFGHVAKAQPDGYTLLLGWDSLIINPSLYSSVPYTLQQYAPITLAITSPQVLLVGSKLPVKNVKEFIEAAKKAPGALTLANAGSGSPGHLAGTLLESHAGVKFIHVPYKGGAPAVSDLVAGHLDALIVTLPAAATGLSFCGDAALAGHPGYSVGS